MAKLDDGGLASKKSLLDEQAGQALTGLFSQAIINREEVSWAEASVAAYKMAQAMIAEKRRLEREAADESDKGE